MQDLDFAKDVGRRIAEVRKDQGDRQAVFADRLGISESAYKNYERGERDLPLKTAGDLCDLFEVNPTWLLQGNGVKYNSEIEPLIQQCEAAVSKFINANSSSSFSSETRTELVGVVTSLALKSGKLPINEIQAIMKVLVK